MPRSFSRKDERLNHPVRLFFKDVVFAAEIGDGDKRLGIFLHVIHVGVDVILPKAGIMLIIEPETADKVFAIQIIDQFDCSTRILFDEDGRDPEAQTGIRSFSACA